MKILSSVLALCIIGSSIAFAQIRERVPMPPIGRGDARVLELEGKVRELERTLYDVDQRLRTIETGGYIGQPLPVPAPGYRQQISCLLVDSGFQKTFLGKADTQLQAEVMARQECAKKVHQSYCNSKVRCSDGVTDLYARGHYCMIIDSGFSKTFSGQGADAIEAEAKAKQACQASVHSSYCGNVTARCEALR